MSDGIAQAAFGGIGLGYLIGFSPITMAGVFSITTALGIGLIGKKTKIPNDTIIGILLAMGMSLGVILISLAPGYAPDLFGYLFGNILTVSITSIISIGILDAVIVIVVMAFFKEFIAISFDEEYSELIGIPVKLLNLLLLCIIALTIVIAIRIIGIVLVIALLTIPATLARRFTYNLKKMMLLASMFGIALIFVGLWISYELDLASGSTIVLFSGIVLFLYLGISRLTGRKKNK
ncbi:MAG: metal ABC transporter permease [Chloroflexi bacterium]|nr:metal ABC transporter permease [Chloroflexota bacterium]